MTYDIGDSAIHGLLGIVVSGLAWAVRRFFRNLDDMEAEQKSQHDQYAKEIRETRQAISRMEGKFGLAPFPYSD